MSLSSQHAGESEWRWVSLHHLWDLARWLNRTRVFVQWWETSVTPDFPQMLNVNVNFRKPYLGRGKPCASEREGEAQREGGMGSIYPILILSRFFLSSSSNRVHEMEKLSCSMLLASTHFKQLPDIVLSPSPEKSDSSSVTCCPLLPRCGSTSTMNVIFKVSGHEASQWRHCWTRQKCVEASRFGSRVEKARDHMRQ